MNQVGIGKFIAKRRKERKLTQAQLAEKLNITDRAVSKWETGKSMPDSSIMLELCEILGITVNELLSGEEVDVEGYEEGAEEDLLVLKREDGNGMAKSAIISILFSVSLLIGIMVCLICDFAISGNLTWSLIPVISIIFAWAVAFPGIKLGKRGIIVSLLSLSVFIIPYLFFLSRLINAEEVFSIGAAMSVAAIPFLWIIAAVFSRIGKTGKLIALGVTFLLAIPFVVIINILLSKMISGPVFDVWDMLSVSILLISAFVSLMCGYTKSKQASRGN